MEVSAEVLARLGKGTAHLIRTRPSGGLASIAFCALNNLGANAPPEADEKQCAVVLVAPFVCWGDVFRFELEL